MKKLAALSLLFAAIFVVGCEPAEPTNEPTQEAIDKANADRAKAIDNDPSMTPEGKQKMKEMLKLNGTAPKENR